MNTTKEYRQAGNENIPCTCTECAELGSCPLARVGLRHKCSAPVRLLMEESSEALVVVIRDGELALYHKFKSQGGALHRYLRSLLQELELRTSDEPSPDPD